MSALSITEYQQALASLLRDPVAEIAIVGRISVELQERLTDTLMREYAQLSECLDSGEATPGSRILLLISPSSIDSLVCQLGAVCQRYPNQVLIELRHDKNDRATAQSFRQTCFALGFRQALHSVSDTTEYQLYEYRLKNYKQAPDWLNSRFWAHPERFNTR